MKKFLFVIATFTLVSFSSCKKDWTCNCTEVGAATGTAPVVTYPINGQTKSQATSACNTQAATLNASGGASVSCSI